MRGKSILEGLSKNALSRMRERFLNYVHVEPNTGCWIWAASFAPNGYGRFKLDNTRISKAHRASYAIFKKDPEKWLCCHRCDNRWCVNPEHIFLGSDLDNNKDMMAKGRRRLGASGKPVGWKLSVNEILEAISRRSAGEEFSKIAIGLPCGQKALRSIVRKLPRNDLVRLFIQ